MTLAPTNSSEPPVKPDLVAKPPRASRRLTLILIGLQFAVLVAVLAALVSSQMQRARQDEQLRHLEGQLKQLEERAERLQKAGRLPARDQGPK